METIRLQTHVTDDGLLKLELPTGLANRKLDILIVMKSRLDFVTVWVHGSWTST